MATITKSADFNDATLLPTISVTLKSTAGATLSGPFTGAAAQITRIGTTYICSLIDLPVGFSQGYVDWDPGDGSNHLVEEINTIELAVTTLLSGIGPYQIPVELRSSAGGVLPYVPITLIRDSDETFQGYLNTDAAGQATFNVGNGSWKLRAPTLPGYGTLADVVVNISGANAALQILTLPKIAASAPTIAGLCTVHFYVRKNGVLAPNCSVEAVFVNKNQAVSDTILSLAVDKATTDQNGYAALRLVRDDAVIKGDGKYRITVKDENAKIMYQKDVLIPAQDEVNAEDLL